MKETRKEEIKEDMEGREGWYHGWMNESRMEQANDGLGKIMKKLRIRLTLQQEDQK